MSTGYIDIPAYGSPRWKSPVATAGVLPTTGNTDGDVRLSLSDEVLYVYNGTTRQWQRLVPLNPNSLFNYYNFY